MEEASQEELEFAADAQYAESILRSAMGDNKACVAALRRALEILPSHAPAILSLGSVEYQLKKPVAGRKLFLSLVALPADTPDLSVIIDKAGAFLIGIGAYKYGLELYRAAVKEFPADVELHSGLGCCAGHEGLHDEAIAASGRALEQEPDAQTLVNDLGWSLFEAGRLEEAEEVLTRAVGMDPADELACENLRLCQEERKRTKPPKASHPSGQVGRVREEEAAGPPGPALFSCAGVFSSAIRDGWSRSSCDGQASPPHSLADHTKYQILRPFCCNWFGDGGDVRIPVHE